MRNQVFRKRILKILPQFRINFFQYLPQSNGPYGPLVTHIFFCGRRLADVQVQMSISPSVCPPFQNTFPMSVHCEIDMVDAYRKERTSGHRFCEDRIVLWPFIGQKRPKNGRFLVVRLFRTLSRCPFIAKLIWQIHMGKTNFRAQVS